MPYVNRRPLASQRVIVAWLYSSPLRAITLR